jgi:ribonuclease T2
MKARALVLGGLLLLPAEIGTAEADVPVTGRFVAAQSCPAFQSFRKSTNPGDVKVEPNDAYEVIAKNKPDATHYRIVIEGAEPEERWVSSSCGRLEVSSSPTQVGTANTVDKGNASGTRATHLLALGWEPTFCEHHREKSECREITATSFDATHLSLHGLWPQPRGTEYCNVSSAMRETDEAHNWDNLPEPEMSPDTLKHLSAVMPGVQSKLERHEWIAHGTCFGVSADSYFARAASLTETVDNSKVSQLFADNIGKTLSADDVRTAFDAAFGPGAGARVTVSCSGHGEDRKITELRIYLAGDVKGDTGLGDLMRAAEQVPPGCPRGLVDSTAR